MSKRIHVVINPASGQPEPILNTLNDVFHHSGVDWDVSITKKYGDGIELARRAVEKGYDVVASYGGDGTVMEVANGLVDSETPMAVFPGGTGNVMSVELNIPQNLAEAAQLAISEDSLITPVDVGKYKDIHFLLRVYIGFDAQRINIATREMRDRFGKAAYVISALKALPESNSVHYKFTLDGESVEMEGVTCMVENAGSLGVGDYSMAPDVSIRDGLLDVFCLKALDIRGLKTAVESIAGKGYDSERFQHWRAKEISIECDLPQPVIGDGQDWG